jgi:hypothetical protein
MSPTSIYRIVAVLLVLYMLGHTLGFARVDPRWGVDAPLAQLRTITFVAQGTPGRTYWGFYLGFGYFCSVLMLLAAALAWQLGMLPHDTLRSLQVISWAFAAAFVVATAITWKYFFTAPVVFSALVTFGLVIAAWRARTA